MTPTEQSSLQNIVVPKKTATYADALQAIGLADLLSHMTGKAWTIEDGGADYRVLTNAPVALSDFGTPDSGFPYVWDANKETEKPAGEVLDYRRELEKRDAMKAAPRGRAAARARAADLPAPEPPDPRLSLAAALSSMRKGWKSDFTLFRWMQEDCNRSRTWVLNRLTGKECAAEAVPSWSNSQVLNPISGKGMHSPKTEARSAGSLNSALIEPFDEWLKLRGLWNATLAYRDDGDYKFMTLVPGEIQIAGLNRVASELRKLNLWGGVKLDIQAVLRCTELLVNHSDVVADGPVFLKGRTPARVLKGLHQSYFKSLGTASALMNDALFCLPDWFPVQTRDDANDLLSIIRTFIGNADDPGGSLAGLNPTRSDEGETLQRFREWLSAGEYKDFLHFTSQFSVHLMSKKSRGEWIVPLSTQTLDILFGKGYQMTDVVTNPGFLSIARAIRNVTIYSKGVKGPTRFDTRFGLAQQWKQKIRSGRDAFLGAVGDFIQQYNWEAKKLSAHMVTTEDLNELVRLAAQDHETVGLLLLAYGYSIAPRTGAATEENQ